ncbi:MULTISPECIES: DUF305 domain-containing protein [Deinococcus]|uniref:DUF305 domain-containing protein n=3 Tax=Deinococcus TaxID=1298 RepID=A0ABQ2PYS6_9DEIO|nr:hypothetical protein GCM10008021_24200 [Deinococcus wulumuqiensis]
MVKPKKTILLTATAVLLAFPLAQAQGMNHSSMHMSDMSSMDLSGMKKLQGKAFDRAFMSAMIPHHQAAVDMAKVVLPVSKDATVKTWANAVIKDQNREINQMSAWLKANGGTDANMAKMMSGSMQGMASMVKSSKTPDVAFVQGMIPHHASAVDMANLALQQGSDQTVLKLARDIVKAQAQEMYDYRQWLKKRGL